MNDKTANEAQQPLGGLLSHLLELRNRLLWVVLTIIVIFAALFPFAQELYTFLAEPLTKHLPADTSLIAIGVIDPFLIPFKLVLMVSFLIALPMVLYHAWAFIAPGLYKHEKKLILPLVVSSVLLFFAGMAFAYFVVFELVFSFLTAMAPEGVSVTPGIGHYLDFVLVMFLAFGIAFETPIATILLVASGVVSADQLAEKRPYVIVVAFIVGMFLTPPDVISQVLLALPMWLLFEVGIVFSRLLPKMSKRDQNDEEDEYHPMTDEEMDAELDRLDDEDHWNESDSNPPK